MGRYGAPKRVRIAAGDLPDDLVHIIFLKLDFGSKVIAGQVCKRWAQLLKAPIAGARHWDVDYDLDTIVASDTLTSTEQEAIVEQFNSTIGRWLVNRAAAIKIVHVSATLSSDQEGVATKKVLEGQLPLLFGCLAKHVNTLELTFHYGSPFASPLLSSSAFLTFLGPMVKKLILDDLMTDITASDFAAICQLSSLEELFIEAGAVNEELGLQEMTSDISKLVNLTTLIVGCSKSLECIPESLSCLQKLEAVNIRISQITDVPPGLARLANLSSLAFTDCGPLRFPPSLQGLKRLTSLCLDECSLTMIPEVLTDLSTLTYLDLSGNNFKSSVGWSWWPTTLSRLTKLAVLIISGNEIISLPPHISGLQQLTMLNVDCNQLRSFPEELSSLQNLRDLQADGNYLPTVPASVLSSLTALTCISLYHQHLEGSATFQVTSSLQPILHLGLVLLDLRQHGNWDPLSLCHLGRAMAEVADRTPLPILAY